MSLNTRWSENLLFKGRYVGFSLAAAGVFLLLLLRLWYLQVISVDRFELLSEKNRTRYMPIAAPRGTVYDRAGELLLDNRPSFAIVAMRQDVRDPDALFTQLAPILAVPAEELAQRWQDGRRLPRYRPVVLADDVPRATMERVLENSVELPGVLAEVKPLRSYPHRDLAAHLFGYLSEITEAELRGTEFAGYRGGDLVGRSGLERRLETLLRGTEGERRLEVDVKGRELRILQTQTPLPGHRVYLTLRKDIQLATERAFGEQAGGAVVLDVRNGEVLALVSRPSYDPALFARGIRGEEWEALLRNPRHPLENKAVKGQYPPGSTFKAVSALAALQTGVATPASEVDCTGKFTLGSKEFRCWKKEGHGVTDLKKALRESCDVWFYQYGMAAGIDAISGLALELGLGRPLGIRLEDEKGGLIPTRGWKKRRFNDRWYDGETVIAAIGQGYVLTTPLQLAVMTATIANGGQVWQPTLVKQVTDLNGNLVQEGTPQLLRSVAFDSAALQAVRQGLEAVVHERGGTGWASRLKGVRVGGKTGTAQVVRRKSDEEEEASKDEVIPYRFRDHALFIAYAPAEAPEVAVAVVVEHGGHGSTAAAPVARAALGAYFRAAGDISAAEPHATGD